MKISSALFVCLVISYGNVVKGRIADELLNKEEPHVVVQPSQETPSPSPPSPSPSPQPNTCYRAPPDTCTKMTSGCTTVAPDALVCCHLDADKLKDELGNVGQNIVNLHIVNATLDKLDVSMATWRRLISMSVTDGNIKEIVGEFKKYSPAVCLNVSNNGLRNITSPRALVNLFNLTTLDISTNHLSSMPHFKKGKNDFDLDMHGNNEMLCRSVLDTLVKHSKMNFINSNTSFCTSSKTFQWFNTTELVTVRQVEVIHELKNDCPVVTSGEADCLCTMVRVDIVQGRSPIFSVGVDCSNRHLKQLPHKLPPNTVQLNVSHNNITSLAPLSDHPSYEHMRELNADYNNIQSIVELEGTKFIDNFIILSLRANKLKTLPTYILSNTFDRNWFSRTIHLAKNNLHCDCSTAKVVKVWLLDKTKHIPDYDEIYCENTGERVIDLVESKVCQQQRDWTDYIYYVIATEVLLLLGLITKVSYDYWVFKTAGYLPWPASKMPKLPCDWLCE